MSVTEEILSCEEALRRAQLGSDVAALNRLLDGSLLFTGLDGAIVTKADDLALHQSGRLRITRMEPVGHRLLEIGESVVVVAVRMEAEAVVEGVSVQSTLQYTRVWRRRPDGWCVVAGHMSNAGK